MKLLIVTQKVDRIDPILGFFHGWIEAFAERCEKVTVIGQLVGQRDLPENVRVMSLGKEKGTSRLVQTLRFWKYQWSLCKEYDVVLVHMTPIWIALGCVSWMLLRKPMYLWYEARGTRLPLRVVLLCARKVFSASEAGMPLKTSKSVIVGHGIDTIRFSVRTQDREEGFLLTVGRVTQAKRLDIILRCLAALPSSYHLRIVGAPITPADEEVLASLDAFIQKEGLRDRVKIAPCTQEELALLLQRALVFLHASETPLDKALLEAMACGCFIVSCSEAARAVLPEACIAREETMADIVKLLCSLTEEEQEALRRDLRSRIEQKHSLSRLADRLVQEMAPATKKSPVR